MSMKTSPFRLIQKLSPEAATKKKKRDVSMAKSKRRTAMRAQNQRIGQNSTTDLHHRLDGGVVRMSKKNNRNVWKHGER